MTEPPLGDEWLRLYREGAEAGTRFTVDQALDLAAGHDPTDVTVLVEGTGDDFASAPVLQANSPTWHPNHLILALIDEVLSLRERPG